MTPNSTELFPAAGKSDTRSMGRPVPSMPLDPRLPEPVQGPVRSGRFADAGASVALAAVGIAVMLAFWQLITAAKPNLPSPVETLAEFRVLMESPFRNLANDKGIFVMLANSIVKVFSGFALAAAVAIPAGFAVGSSKKLSKIFNPLIQVFRPVSPLAWYPLALTFFFSDSPSPKITFFASILVIAVTALWPTLINTAVGVAGIPDDHKNVAKVFKFSRGKYVRQVLFPYSMGAIITGLRLSMGIGWLVIVAVEMLSGGDGIGFFVWDRYNNSNLPAVVVAIFFIGIVGLILDTGFRSLAKKFDYSQVSK